MRATHGANGKRTSGGGCDNEKTSVVAWRPPSAERRQKGRYVGTCRAAVGRPGRVRWRRPQRPRRARTGAASREAAIAPAGSSRA
jgi:hypothetical protein